MIGENFFKEFTELHGESLTLVSKLEAAYGIDVEYLKSCGTVALSDSGSVLRFDYTAYGKKFQRTFGFDEKRKIIYVNGEFIPMDDKAKAAIIRTLIISAARLSNKDAVVAQQAAFRRSSVESIRNHVHAGKFSGVDV
jgi:hypothetical protein